MPLIKKKLALMNAAGATATANGTTYLVETFPGDGVPDKDVDWSVWFRSKNNSGDTPSSTSKVQHSPNGTTWIDLVTAAQVTTGEAVERKELSGTFGPYFRAVSTLGGTTPNYDVEVELCSTVDFKITAQ